MITRTSDATKPSDHRGRPLEPFDWNDVRAKLMHGPGPCWLSATDDGAPHVRPVFAAWAGDGFVFASNAASRKTACFDREPRVSIAIDLTELHLVVEGRVRRLTSATDLDRARRAFQEVFDWPTEVVGDQLDASYAAPTSGGPPFEVWKVQPARAFGFPTADRREPTRWTFDT